MAQMQKLLAEWGTDKGVQFMDFLGLGAEISLILTVIAELFAPVLIIVGWKTRWAALTVAFTMFVAAFVAHGDDPFQKGIGPALLEFKLRIDICAWSRPIVA